MKVTKAERGWMRRLKDIEILYLSPEDSHGGEVEYFSCIYIEASIDFNDIRTGYKNAVKLARALKIYDSHLVYGWSEEIIYDANIDRIQEVQPHGARLCSPPEFLDAEFIDNIKKRYIEHLMRSWKKILYCNSELNIYSGLGESRDDFQVRCREQFLVQMREELKDLRVVYNRLQEQLKEKYIGINEEELPESASLTPETTNRDIYSQYTERIAELFLDADSEDMNMNVDTSIMEKNSELEERLIALTAEARRKIALLRENYEKKAEIINEYILRPNLRNIHCERSGILWIPQKVE